MFCVVVDVVDVVIVVVVFVVELPHYQDAEHKSIASLLLILLI